MKKEKKLSFYDEFIDLTDDKVMVFFSFMQLPDEIKDFVYIKYGNGIDNEPTKDKLSREDRIKYHAGIHALKEIVASNSGAKLAYPRVRK